jgi:thymidylate synthase (FAD)
MIDVLDHGFVRLDDSMADDLSVVNAARVSFGKRSDSLEGADQGLIEFLMRERHGTPFEHNSFRFHVKCPIFVAREWFRHRIGSFNELSGRYKEIPTVGYVPAPQDVRTQIGKPGAYIFDSVSQIRAEETCDVIQEAYNDAYRRYNEMLELGIAKELARVVLPVGTYTEFYWTVNARSLMNFLSLRIDETAQYEIRVYAEAVNELFVSKMPLTAAAWEKNKRVAP